MPRGRTSRCAFENHSSTSINHEEGGPTSEAETTARRTDGPPKPAGWGTEPMTTTAKLPERIRASISPDAMRKVKRFFSADLGDIFLELFQNARRAGATRVDVRTVPNIAAGRTQVTVTDDGRGIADPATVLAFGESQWSEATTQSEDPAGMGVYSFAQKGAEITSTPEKGPAWKAVLTPEHFTGEKPAEVIRIARGHTPGTSISFTVDHDGLDPGPMETKITSKVKSAAKHQRIGPGDKLDIRIEPVGPQGTV